MAVEDKYVSANISSGVVNNLLQAINSGSGIEMKISWAKATIAAADDDGSKYRMFKNFHADTVIHRIEYFNDAVTAGTAYDFGIYDPDLGAVVTGKVDYFDANLDMSSARAIQAPLRGMANVARADYGKALYEMAGHTLATRKMRYDIVATADTVGTAAGGVWMVIYHSLGA